MKNKKWLMVTLISFGIIAVLISFLCIGIYWMVYRSVPNYDISLEKQGVNSETTIWYDEFAAPHIDAKNLEDLFYAQGFAHARERLWQMDFNRRICEGSLSEVLGEATLPIDKFSRTIGFQRLSEKIWLEASKSDTARRILTSYANGVNAFIALTRQGKMSLPIEFAALQYEPKDWTPQNSIGMAKLMAWVLNMSWNVDIVMSEIALKLGKEKAALLFPDYPANKPLIVDSVFWKTNTTADGASSKKRKTAPRLSTYGASTSQLEVALPALQAFLSWDKSARNLSGWGNTSHFGSNCWAVSGKKTQTGKALFANDPHLKFTSPSQWMDMHLSCANEGINVAGSSLPGSPLIVLGKNEDIAWGLTNMMLDDSDFFIWPNEEAFANTPGYQEVEEHIYVKDNVQPIVYRVKTLPKYTLIPDEVVHGLKKTSSPILKKYAVAIKWTGYETSSSEIMTFFGLAKATSWQDFRKALSRFGSPGGNFVYADAKGNIGYQAAGYVPIRNVPPNGNAVLLRNALDSNDAWKGFVPFDEMPSLYNPSSGIIATANNRITKKEYPYFLTSHWEPASRAERIWERLSEANALTVEGFKSIQSDVVSPHVRDIMAVVMPILNSTASTQKLEATTFLKNWEYDFGTTSVGGLIYSVFFNVLLQETLRDELGQQLFKDYLPTVNVPTRAMYEILLDTAKAQFFDNVNTTEIETKETIIIKSFIRAVSIIEKELGKEPKKWFWGEAHKLTAQHIFSASGSPIGKYFDSKTYPSAGISTTVNNGEYQYHDSLITMNFPHELGPSSRRIVDFSNTDGSYLSILPGGNSGHIKSPHFGDQLELWVKGEYRKFETRNISNKGWKATRLLP